MVQGIERMLEQAQENKCGTSARATHDSFDAELPETDGEFTPKIEATILLNRYGRT